MQVALHLNIQNWRPDMSDAQAYREDLRLAERAEAQGFDAIWCVEHHFDGYSLVPDNIQMLSWLAGRTSRIALGTGAVILPWHDPLEVAEKLIMLDNMSNGRLLVGFGRGLAAMEYGAFGIDMNESRERFDEAAAMIVGALETGYMAGDGPHYPQRRVELRPRAERSFADRIYTVAMSADSYAAAGAMGATMMTFVTGELANQMLGIEVWRTQYRETTGRWPNPPVLTDHTFCHEDEGFAREMAMQYGMAYFASNVAHYGYDSDHFDNIRSYRAYADMAAVIKERGVEQSALDFVNAQIWGTPEQIVEQYRQRWSASGGFAANVVFSYGCMPHELAEQSQDLFAQRVLPALKAI